MKRKGFTLVELVVAIALSALIIAALISLIVAITKYTEDRAAEFAEENELNEIEALFNVLSDYDGAEYTFSVVTWREIPEENKYTSEINVTKSDDGVETDIISLVYTLNTGAEEHVVRTLSLGEKEITLENVGDITFGGTDGLLKCTVGENAVYMLSVGAATVAAAD